MLPLVLEQIVEEQDKLILIMSRLMAQVLVSMVLYSLEVVRKSISRSADSLMNQQHPIISESLQRIQIYLVHIIHLKVVCLVQ